MNPFIESQIINMKTCTESFIQGCRMSALIDDRKTSKEEQKKLDMIEKASKEYIMQLNKILKK